jgi:hypothetical protein
MQWMDDIKSVTGLSVNYLNQLMKDKKKWNLLVKHSQEEKTDQCLIQGEGNGKLLL